MTATPETTALAAPRTRESPHDLRLPAWGPYSKRYAGISHVADPQRGVRFDLAVLPGYFRGDLLVPDALRPSGFHPWEAASGLQYVSYRYQLEWKDQLYCDVSFSAHSASARLICCELVNRTDVTQQVVAHAVAAVDFPRIGPHREWLRGVEVESPASVVWVDGLDYATLSFAKPRASDGLMRDALLQGEQRAHGATGGSVLGSRFGRNAGDHVGYAFTLDAACRDTVVRLRYRAPAGNTAKFRLSGVATGTLVLAGTGAMETVDVAVGPLRGRTHELGLTSLGSDPCEIDGFSVGERTDVERVRYVPTPFDASVQVDEGPVPGSALLSYPAATEDYGVCWSIPDAVVRRFAGDDLTVELRGTKYDRSGAPEPGRSGHAGSVYDYVDLLTGPLYLPPGTTHRLYGLVCSGERDAVAAALERFTSGGHEQAEQVRARVAASVVDLAPNPSGQRHLAAQQRMAATTLTNVVYPAYARRRHVMHFAPGRWWDSLYTWDSGFIALGLLEVDEDRGQDCLDAYLTEPGDRHAAYIHHGTPVPTQQYAFAELCARRPSADLMRQRYPRLRQQYQFLAGQLPGSTTLMPSGMLNTFRYFYNSGGWDDYPAQAHVHAHGLADLVAPMVTTAQAIRVAKMLTLAATVASSSGALDRDEMEAHVAGYRDDVGRFAAALRPCWDNDAGYFGYAMHDEAGQRTGILRDDSGVNLNMGLDGVHPLIAGICLPEQRDALLKRLFSPRHLWTDIGISTVDQSAPYYRHDGYWNGSVWMAHQWFLWKAMLDLGRPDLAQRIAGTGLQLWTDETDRTYNCWEHFTIATGRGSGWHQFSGLSTPVLSWFATYHRPGTLTTGFDTWTASRRFSADRSELTADLVSMPGSADRASVVACMAPGREYHVSRDGVEAEHTAVDDGVLHITWPTPAAEASGAQAWPGTDMTPVASSLSIEPV